MPRPAARWPTSTATAVKVNANGRSMGLALTSCVVPPRARRRSTSATTRSRSGSASTASPVAVARSCAPVDDMAEWLVSPIVSDLGLTRGDKVLAFVNGMGGTPLIELYIAFDSVANASSAARASPSSRSLVGNYITSLEMAGFSVTLLRLDDELTRLLGRAGPHGRPALGRLSPSCHSGRPPPTPPSGAAAARTDARLAADRPAVEG